MLGNVQTYSRVRWNGHASKSEIDHIAVEEPLEIQVQGIPLAVVMRTPGHDEELALGFLMTEGIIRNRAEIASLRHCSIVPHPDAEDNVLQVRLHDGRTLDLERLRRNFYASSSCGVCGKASLDKIRLMVSPLIETAALHPKILYQIPQLLRKTQLVFDVTGGLHAAALIDWSGQWRVTREDIGRHNAVDKTIGWALQRSESGLEHSILVVSGRVSFEIVQKAVMVGIPMIAGVSAPSSLAIKLSQEMNATLIGFLRGDRMNVYSGNHRISVE